MTFSEFLLSYLRNLKEPLDTFLSYQKAYKNYFHVIKGKLANEYPIKAVLKNGKNTTINNLFNKERLFLLSANS